MPTANEIAAGQAVYQPWLLRNYDWFVLGFSNRLLWRCPVSELRALYAGNLSARHLDIGVGTGYYLDRVAFPAPDPAITLLDLNPNCLAMASARIARYAPATVVADVLQPLPSIGRFDSAGLCYLLHCLPGTIPEKAIAFDHIRPLLSPGARVFGATILQGDAPRSRAAQALMDFYNRKGVFSNAGDTLADLSEALTARFTDVRVRIVGAVALFEARAG